MNLKPIIGLEIHCELRTKSKLFCGCPADHFGKEPNTQTCPVCLGLPGELPVPNKKAIDWTILLGLSLGCTINNISKFDRKHYFYPDLPMGFQISQYDEPLCRGGFVETQEGRVNLTRVHLEIDTGKLQHSVVDGKNVSLVDFNRSGVALMEIVTEPQIYTGSQAKDFAKNLQAIIRYLEISDCDMEKGSMRLEANISWGLDLGYKVEVKNLNSFKFLDKAIIYELDRQKKALEKGETLRQETRGWSEAKGITYPQRSKETAEDYRYLPDPDLPPMEFTDAQISDIRKRIPELPIEKKKRFMADYALPENYAAILVENKQKSKLYESVFAKAKDEKIEPKKIADLIVNKGLSGEKAQDFVTEAKKALTKDFSSDSDVESAINDVIKKEAKAVEDYKKGKTQVIGFLVGMVQKKLQGKGDSKLVAEKLIKSINV